MKSYYLVDSKDLAEIANSIRNAEQNISFDFILTNEDIAYPSDSNNHWKIISTYYSSTLTMENYEFEVSRIFNFNISNFAYNIVINSISPTLDLDLIVKISDNSTVIVSTIPTATHLDGTDMPGIISISGTIYQVKNNEGTNTITIPAGETSAGEAPSNKLEWPIGFINGIDYWPSLVPYTIEDFISGRITTISDDKITLLRSYAFAYRSELLKANFTNCSIINKNAFISCNNLSQISFPNCLEIGQYAFYSCSSLESISFQNCTNIMSRAFCYCSSLSNVDFPNCLEIGQYAFWSCLSLKSISFQNCTNIMYSAFANCFNLLTANFPNCLKIEEYAFAACSSLSYINLPMCSILKSNAFYKCLNLISLYLMNSTVVLLENSVFESTPIDDYLGATQSVASIYVPSSLYNDYINDEQWEQYSDKIVGV